MNILRVYTTPISLFSYDRVRERFVRLVTSIACSCLAVVCAHIKEVGRAAVRAAAPLGARLLIPLADTVTAVTSRASLYCAGAAYVLEAGGREGQPEEGNRIK